MIINLLPFTNILRPFVIQSISEIEDDVVEDGGIDVFGHLHEEEPIAVVTLFDHHADVVAVDAADAVAEQQVSESNIEKYFKCFIHWTYST